MMLVPPRILVVNQNRPIDPTPEEIRERCLAIQAEWTEDERRKRAVGSERPTWMVPQAARPEAAERAV